MKMGDFRALLTILHVLGHKPVVSWEGKDKIYTFYKNDKHMNGARVKYVVRKSIVLMPQVIRNNR
jgi:hypothetical protein